MKFNPRGAEPVGGRGSAIDIYECARDGPWGGCTHGRCGICGFPKHYAIHGPIFGAAPGTEAYGHQFVPGMK